MQPAALFTQFTRFTLLEYLRSGRVLIELAATIAMFMAAVRGRALDADGFFANAALFSLVMALYTGSTIIGLGDRPHGYLLVIRPLGRTGYLVGLYSAILIHGTMIALAARSQFGRLVASGIMVAFWVYAFINIAMVTGLIPVVGEPLPLVSYGGTALMALMISFGLVINVSVHRNAQVRAGDEL